MAFQPAELSKASRAHVLAALSTIRNRAPQDWLAAGHPAATGELPMSWNQLRALPPGQAVDAVAVSIPTHCVDGWTFAARSMNALLAGDLHACRHMAYYAQLRPSLCILANLGVGLFNGLNFVIDVNGQIVRIDPTPKANSRGLGTHSIVWTALEAWGQDPVLAELFLDLLKIKHVSLRDMLDVLWPGFIGVTTVGTLISAWGIDLKRGIEDHKYRNNSSYAPHALNPIATRTSTSLRFVGGSWRMFEPSGGSGFDNLDRHLLRKILRAQLEISDPGGPVEDGPLGTNYGTLPAAIRQFCPREFVLSQPITPDILRNAYAKTKPAKPLHMLSRALLLLRTATAFTHTSLIGAGIDVAGGELTAWLDEIAVTRGFCADGQSIGDGTGLWDDMVLAIDELEHSRTPAPANLNSWKSRTPNGFPVVGEIERIALWSLSA